MNNEYKEIPELDWVAERAKCTSFKIFETLRFQVQEDIKKRNTLRDDKLVSRTFTYTGFGGGFSASYFAYEKHVGMTFLLTDDGIDVKNISSQEVVYKATLTISDDGKCRLRVNDREYNLWQFRKLALQDLFFLSGETSS